MQKEILGYYTKLLGSEFASRVEAMDALARAISKVVPTDMREALIAPVRDIEVVAALKSIKNDKAPSQDGFNSAFFKMNWDIVGPNLWRLLGIFPVVVNCLWLGMQQLLPLFARLPLLLLFKTLGLLHVATLCTNVLPRSWLIGSKLFYSSTPDY